MHPVHLVVLQMCNIVGLKYFAVCNCLLFLHNAVTPSNGKVMSCWWHVISGWWLWTLGDNVISGFLLCVPQCVPQTTCCFIYVSGDFVDNVLCSSSFFTLLKYLTFENCTEVILSDLRCKLLHQSLAMFAPCFLCIKKSRNVCHSGLQKQFSHVNFILCVSDHGYG